MKNLGPIQNFEDWQVDETRQSRPIRVRDSIGPFALTVPEIYRGKDPEEVVAVIVGDPTFKASFTSSAPVAHGDFVTFEGVELCITKSEALPGLDRWRCEASGCRSKEAPPRITRRGFR